MEAMYYYAKQLEIINPGKTKWRSLATTQEITSWINKESKGRLANMIPQDPEKLLIQMKKELTLIAIADQKVVGHVTLWKYNTPGWGELGSLIIHPLFRNQGIGELLCAYFAKAFPLPLQIVATTKTEIAMCVVLSAGFENISFETLREISEPAWRECCPCYSPPECCPKRDKECRLLIRR